MTNPLKIGVVTTLLALSLSACSTQSVDEINTNSAVASIPESGPLVQNGGTTNVSNTTRPQAEQNTQAQYEPDYDASTYVPAPAYNPPQNQYQGGTQSYDDGGSTDYAETTPVANYGTNTNSGSNNSAYDMYDNYGRPKAQPKYDYSASTEGYPDTAGSSYGGGSSGSASGAHAVQVLATGNSSKAQSMKQQMQSLGLTAVVDNVGGLYKVRIPFATRGEASSNLSRIRSVSGESGAFVTTR